MTEFINKVEKDITKNLINVDHYMRDLKKHALHEYQELYKREVQMPSSKKKKRVKNKKKLAAEEQPFTQIPRNTSNKSN